MNTPPDSLRAKEAAQLAGTGPEKSDRSMEQVLHELQVHQIELEMQNETLRQAQIALEISRDQYRDMYDFAPTAYFTLTEECRIIDVNQTGAALLGVARLRLINRKFTQFVCAEFRQQWQLFCQMMLRSSRRDSCELQCTRDDRSVFFAHIDCLRACDEHGKYLLRITLTDTTEQQRMKIEIEASRQALSADRLLLSSILDNAPIGIWMLGSDHKIKFINKTFCDAVGFTEQQFMAANHYSDLLPHKTAANCMKSDSACFTQDAMHISREWLDFADGRAHLLEITKAKLFDEGGRVIGLIGLTSDITERWQAEQNFKAIDRQLSESRQLLEAIVENIPAMVFVKRASDLCFELFNRAGEELLGYSRDEVLGKGNCDFWPGEQADWFTAEDRLVLASKEPREIPEEPIQIKNGETRYLRTWKVALRDPQGEASHLLGISIDITERLWAETRLRESEEKFRAIFEGTLDGVALVDETGTIVEVNPEFVQQTGMSPSQLKQMRIWELRPADKAQLASDVFIEVLKTGFGNAVDLKFQKQDGRVIHVEVRGTVITIGAKKFLQCISHDVTERKRTERALLEHQQLLRELAAQGVASREAELKHIAREVHDELGQLLTALRMDVSLLRIQFGERDPVLMSKIRDILVLVDKSIQGVRDVTGNLRPPVLDMGVIPAIRWLSEEFSARMNIVCTLQVSEETICLDDARTLTLFRIVQESLTNIARHAQATRVKITINHSEADISVEISDDGRGFNMRAMAPGKTFGLMGMQERALAVSGKVEIDSSPMVGTVISVCIPQF